jgi:DNA-binding GntR family transcriptional regulator
MIEDIKVWQAPTRTGPIENIRLVDSALEAVRSAILRGRFVPGERLLEVPLAQELGISRSSLREALHLLEKDGIIQSLPRHGKFVQTFDLAGIDELYSLRKVLEPFAADLIGERIGEANLTALQESLRRLEEVAEMGDLHLLARCDILFHQTLIELPGHALLKRAWMENISGKLHMLLNITEPTHQSPWDVVDRHRRITEGIASGDRLQAQELIRRHIDDGWERARLALTQRTGEKS